MFNEKVFLLFSVGFVGTAPLKEIAEGTELELWCGGWDLNHTTKWISLATNAATTTFLGIENWIRTGIIIIAIGTGLLFYIKKLKH